MGEVESSARDIANLRIEVNTLSEQISGTSLPKALASIRRTVTVAAILVSAALLVSSAIHACATREVRDLRGRVDRLEAREPEAPPR